MWSPSGSSRRVHLVHREGGSGDRGMPRIRRIACGKAAGGRGDSLRREWLGVGRRIQERDEGRDVRRRRSRAVEEDRRSE